MRASNLQSSGLALCLAGLSLLFVGCSSEPGEQDGEVPAHAFADGEAGLETGTLPERFGYGRAATAAEIMALDIDVAPDGTGLPPGRGTVAQGAALYAAQCAGCHGAEGQGVPQVGTRLVGLEPIDSTGWNRTIGNYWPYATTVFDYIRRAMPFDRPGSLSDAETYALTAYLLHLNEIVPADVVIDARTLPQIVMPARNRFVPDDREASPRVR